MTAGTPITTRPLLRGPGGAREHDRRTAARRALVGVLAVLAAMIVGVGSAGADAPDRYSAPGAITVVDSDCGFPVEIAVTWTDTFTDFYRDGTFHRTHWKRMGTTTYTNLNTGFALIGTVHRDFFLTDEGATVNPDGTITLLDSRRGLYVLGVVPGVGSFRHLAGITTVALNFTAGGEFLGSVITVEHGLDNRANLPPTLCSALA